MEKELKVLRKIIAVECVNHFTMRNGITNLCVEKDHPCKYFEDSEQLPRCRYLEGYILPADKHKAAAAMCQAVIASQQDGERISNAKVKRVMERAEVKGTTECSRCKIRFRANNNRQRYCDDCKKIVQREQSRTRMQNMRKAGSGVTL